MSGPIPNLQFQSYNPVDSALRAAMGVYQGLGQGRGQQIQNQMNSARLPYIGQMSEAELKNMQAEAQIAQIKAQNPALLAGGDASNIWGLMNLGGGGSQQGGMPSQGSGGAQMMGRMGAPTSAPSLGGQQGGMPSASGSSRVSPVQINDLIQYHLQTPATQAGMQASAQAQAQFPYQAALARQQAELNANLQMGIKQFDTSNELLASTGKVSNSALAASADINHFEDSMKKISPLLNAPIIGGLTGKDAKMQSKPYREAQQAANSLIIDWAPVMTQNGILQDSTLKMVQESKLSPDSPREVNESVISIMRPAAKRMQELSPFMNYAIKELKVDPQTAQSLWLEYNSTMPVDPFMPGGNDKNLGKYREFISNKLNPGISKEMRKGSNSDPLGLFQ